MIFFAPIVVKYDKIKRNSVNKTKPCYSEHILPVRWPLVVSSFCCTTKYKELKTGSYLFQDACRLVPVQISSVHISAYSPIQYQQLGLCPLQK